MPDNDRWRDERDRGRNERDPWPDEGGRESFGGGSATRPQRRGGTEGFGYGGGYEPRDSDRFAQGGRSRGFGAGRPEGFSNDREPNDRPGWDEHRGGAGQNRSDDVGNDYYSGFYGADQGYGRPQGGPGRGQDDRGRHGRVRVYGGDDRSAAGRRDEFRRDAGRSGGGYGREESGRDDRGFLERAGDEIASWFGDDDADRRRRHDAAQGDEGAQHHRGRGPRNYQRSDERIREDINDRLTEDPHIDASDIEVTVANREATLSGSVDSRFAKRHAEDIAESASGVTHVQNNLRVKDRQSASGSPGLGGAGSTPGGGSTGGLGGSGPAGSSSSGAGSSGLGGTGSGGGLSSAAARPSGGLGGTAGSAAGIGSSSSSAAGASTHAGEPSRGGAWEAKT